MARFLILLLLFLPLGTDAHGTGLSLEKPEGTHLIDVGYDQPGKEGTPVLFDFDMVTADTRAGLPFSSVWFRVEKEGKTIFASGIHRPSFGRTTAIFTFPDAGAYTLSVRFEKDGDKVGEAEFPFPVSSADARTPILPVLLSGCVGLFLGGAGVFILKRRKNEK